MTFPRVGLHFEKQPSGTWGGSLPAPDAPGDWARAGALPSPQCEVIVAMPVRDEAPTIAAALASLVNQTDVSGRRLDPRRYAILVLANNCSDETAAVARQFGERHPAWQLQVLETTLAAPDAHVGKARRLVMDEACRQLWQLGRPRGIIASTDGDTRVGPHWVGAMLAEIAAGVDAVGGRIWANQQEVASLEEGVRWRYRRDYTYRTLRAAYESACDPEPVNPWPRHDQYFGASMAVTAETYQAAGGLPALPVLEDMAFARSLERIDARVRHSPRVRVQTSLRSVGKVQAGLSTTLRDWSREARAGEAFLVESAAAIARMVQDRQCVRLLWNARAWSGRRAFDSSLPRAADRLEVDVPWLRGSVGEATSFGVLWQSVMDRQTARGLGWQSHPRTEIQQTIADLRARFLPRRLSLRAQHAPAGRAGIFLPAARPDAAMAPGHRWQVRGTPRAPGHPSMGNPGPAASNAPGAGDRLAATG
jgi:hypothetical protein